MASLAEIGGLAIQFPPDFPRPNEASLFQRRLAAAIAQECHATLDGPPASTPKVNWCTRALLSLDANSRVLLYLFIIDRLVTVTPNEVFDVADAEIQTFVADFLAKPGLSNYILD